MSHGLACSYSDGETLHAYAAHVELFDNGFLRLTGHDFQMFAAAPTVVVSERLGEIPYFLRLPEGGIIELPWSHDADALVEAIRPPTATTRLLEWMENHAQIATTAAVLFAAVALLTLWQGQPRLARRTADRVPANIEAQSGLAGYVMFAQVLQPSETEESRRLHRVATQLESVRRFHLAPQFRLAQLDAANAFALPGGIIVVTDQLVHAAVRDDELAAVLAHELGHIELRHGLQMLLRNRSEFLAVSALTGDVSKLPTFAGTLPSLLLESGYTPEFEREADAYAIDLLREAHIDPRALATILHRLDKMHPREGKDFSYLATHPSKDERLRLIREKIETGR